MPGKGTIVGANFEDDSVWCEEKGICCAAGQTQERAGEDESLGGMHMAGGLCLVIQGCRFEPWFGQDSTAKHPCTVTFVKANKPPITIDTAPFHHFVDDLLVTFSETAVMFTNLEPVQMGTMNIKGEVLSISHKGITSSPCAASLNDKLKCTD